ncbi:hypothetical protein HME9302_00016 [Alteripontixanthobacter maritimus]|uniref:Uncharacterized protein n=1 Tax=Alteripontixanthobacter maritimus TaxID=2161824 RepID=A0A369QSD3_9SPHN|nr:hypothetical protein [Alteripontixanthobacter maritimus]RDC66565.1 hypothetical protein HME9302_00016 [Alteripontixanthobacter maritimus]
MQTIVLKLVEGGTRLVLGESTSLAKAAAAAAQDASTIAQSEADKIVALGSDDNTNQYFDGMSFVDGVTFGASGPERTANAAFYIAENINVEGGGVQYSITPAASGRYLVFYDKDGAYLGTILHPANTTQFNTLSNPAAVAMEVSGRTAQVAPSALTISKGATLFPNDTFNGDVYLRRQNLSKPGGALGLDSDDKFDPVHLRTTDGKNLHRPGNVEDNRALLQDAGGTSELSAFATTNFVQLIPGERYSFSTPSSPKRVSFHSAADDTAFVSQATSSGDFTVPAGAPWVRISFRKTDTPIGSFQIVLGDLPAQPTNYAGDEPIQKSSSAPKSRRWWMARFLHRFCRCRA